jgi:hypothetical protein
METLTAAMIATAAIIASLPCFNSDSRQRLNSLESTREDSPKGSKNPVGATCPGTFVSTKTIDREHPWTFGGLLERNAVVTATNSSEAIVKVGVFILRLFVMENHYTLNFLRFRSVEVSYSSCHDKIEIPGHVVFAGRVVSRTTKNPNPLVRGLRRELRELLIGRPNQYLA